MAIQLLPNDFDEQISNAVKIFWANRGVGCDTQEGARGNVISGKNMDGFLDVVNQIALRCGLDPAYVLTARKAGLTLPGYFRANKNWDALIIYKERLVAVFEFKSHVGSFGKNSNNRTEEVIGSAIDLREAFQKEAYNTKNHKKAVKSDFQVSDPRSPFLGYLMLLQECEESLSPVRADSRHYHVFPEFVNASYARRYQILCERLVDRKLYEAASLVLSRKDTEGWRSLSDATSPKNMFAVFAAHILAVLQG